MSGALISTRARLVRLGFTIGLRLSLRPTVVLATSHAATVGGNLEAIRAALARRSPPINVTVLAHRAGGGLSGKLASAFHAIIAGYHLARARLFIVDDYYFPIYVVKPRDGTTIVQTWHASGAFKKMGYSLADKTFGADAALLRRVRIHSNYDLCLVSAERFAPAYADAFQQPLGRFTSRIGIPRTDALLDAAWRDRAVANVRGRYGIPEGRRVVLYAPTFRGDRVTSARHDEHLNLGRLRAVIGEGHVVLLRLHPFVLRRVRLDPSLEGFVIDVSDHHDIHELMPASDLLITDYSSAIYEYSLLSRPILFFAPDHKAYERERGFYLNYQQDLPGPIFDDTDALADYVRAGRFDIASVERFRAASFDVADGRASVRFVDEVVLRGLKARY